MENWTRHAVYWHVYPLGFVGAPSLAAAESAVNHRLGQVSGWLDYAITLGANGLALGPIFAASSHGYDTVDFFRIDPRLGEEADFSQLIAAAHASGMTVLLDGVFNHVGRAHPIVQAALAGDAQARELVSWSGAELALFEGHDQLVELNHDNPAVADMVLEVMRYWCARGVDGWRLDAAYTVQPSFWRSVLPRLRAEFPHVFIFGEMIQGDYAGYVTESGLDSVTQYELWKALWSSSKDHNYFELAHAVERHNGFLHPQSGAVESSFIPVTFVGNHDVTRVASQVADEALPLVHAAHLLLPGVPLIYYGDELAYRGVKEERVGGDDEIRPAFPATPAERSELGAWLYRQIQELISVRRRHPWIVDAHIHLQEVTSDVVVWRLDAADPGDQSYLWVALNNSAEPATLPLSATEVIASSQPQSATPNCCPPHAWWVGV